MTIESVVLKRTALFCNTVIFMSDYICALCPRRCSAARSDTQGRGYCGLGTLPRVARCAPHFWEEPCISGTKGSGTIFFTGCVLSCVFCQNYAISQERHGRTLTVEQLSDEIKRLEEQGVHNINLVSPTPYIESIIRCFELYKPEIPVVYNTGGYERPQTLRRLEGIVDIYLPDMKYIDPELSKRFSGAEDYPEAALLAIKEMVRQTGAPVFDDDGMMKSGTIVRHLILPQHTKNSIGVLELLKREFDKDILVSLMGQYIPMGRASEFKELGRRITAREYDKVLMKYEELGLDGYVQELSSAKESYVPDFDI